MNQQLPKKDVLHIINAVSDDFDGNGISSIGACAAVRAIEKHWKDHLSEAPEGLCLSIVTSDLQEVIHRLEAMQVEISDRCKSQADGNQRTEAPRG